MLDYTYLIVGGGMTADAAAHAIREADPAGEIGLLSAEPHPPYNRPPLSKALWKGEAEDSIRRNTAATGAELHLGRRAVALDLEGRTVTDDHGAVYRFKALLLATGGAPRRLAPRSDRVIYSGTLNDYRQLRALAREPLHFAVIGGGFIGSEIAAALRSQGRAVTMVVSEAGLGARAFPAELSCFLVDYYREKGVDMRVGAGMAGMEEREGACVVRPTTGGELRADGVGAGVGILPEGELAAQAGPARCHTSPGGEDCRSTPTAPVAA